VPSTSLLPPPLASSRPRALALVAALFTFLFSAYIFTASADLFSTGDTTIRVELAENVIGRHSLDLNGWKIQYAPHVKKEAYDPRVSVGREGKTYSTYLPGQPVAIIPFDFMGSQIAIHFHWPYGPTVLWVARLVGPLFGALEVTLFFMFAMRLGYTLRRSLALSLIFGFATSVWPDEQSVLEHTEVAFFLLLAMYCAYRFREQRRGMWYLVFAGSAIGGAVITRYQDAFLGLLALGLYVLFPGGMVRAVRDRIVRLVMIGIGIVPFAGIIMWYNWFRFGSVLASGHYETVFGYTIWKGALGLLVSPGKGLLWYCPVVFLLALAGPRFARRFPALTVSFGAMTAGFFLLYGYVTYWHGDPAWGPRYMYATLPFLILPLGELFRDPVRKAPAIWVAALAIIGASFVIQLSAVSVSPWRSWYKVISYEENQGHTWSWFAARYRYHWNYHESPLNFQVHGLYALAYNGVFHTNKYEIVPPNEDPVLDQMTVDYAINQWNLWWKSDEFDWWMGRQKIIAMVTVLLALMGASGTYLAAEAAGAFEASPVERGERLVTEAA